MFITKHTAISTIITRIIWKDASVTRAPIPKIHNIDKYIDYDEYVRNRIVKISSPELKSGFKHPYCSERNEISYNGYDPKNVKKRKTGRY